MSDPKVDVGQVRVLIQRDLDLVGHYAQQLREMAAQVEARVLLNRTRLMAGEPMGSQVCLFASDLDAQASRVARRIDHLDALTMLAYSAEEPEAFQ